MHRLTSCWEMNGKRSSSSSDGERCFESSVAGRPPGWRAATNEPGPGERCRDESDSPAKQHNQLGPTVASSRADESDEADGGSRFSFYPLTAPAVRPARILRWKTSTRMTSGNVTTTEAAIRFAERQLELGVAGELAIATWHGAGFVVA